MSNPGYCPDCKESGWACHCGDEARRRRYEDKQPSLAVPFTMPPQGCICPPTSEQTCQSPTCPRQNHFAKAVGQ